MCRRRAPRSGTSETCASTFRISSVAAIAKTPSAKVSSGELLVRRLLLEAEPEDLFERRDGVRENLLDAHRPPKLTGDGREGRILQPARRDPFRERRRIEVDVERIPVRGHPLGH